VTAAADTTAALPGRIVGPSALGGSWKRFLYLSLTLALTDFKLRFFGSVLGYFWQLLRPLLLFGVLYFVFTEFVKVGEAVPFYPVVLLSNILLFTFFQDGTGAVSSMVDREALVRKIQFPRMAIPVATVLMAAMNLTLNSVVILAFALASGVEPRVSWLQMPLLLGLLIVLILGLAMFLSAAYVRYRDVKPIWEVVLQMLFYASPVIYALETIGVSDTLRQVMALNPIAMILQQFRHAVIDPGAPTAADMAGGYDMLLIPGGLIVGAFALGYWYFNRSAPYIAEEL
jgi:ABC-2 type transport system permease protein